MSLSIDWSRLEEVVERAVRKARSEELRDIAEAIKTLADFMRTGFKEMLDRIDKVEKRLEAVESTLLKHSESIEEMNKTLMEHSKRIEELTKVVQEHTKTLQEHSRILQEHSKRLEELSKRVEEMNKVLMEHSKRLEEHSKRLEELAKEVARQGVVLGSIGRRWGKDLEKMVLELYRHVLEERGIIPEKIERFAYVDSDGRYYVKGSKIEFDIYMHNDRIYLVEIKSHADVEDVEWLYKRAEIYEKLTKRKPDKLILVAIHIDDDAYARAKELGIDVIYGAIIP
ncbi:MAG: DUF3782 domain-containing protein [Desulfurococcaceae archaeon]|nr:DUF3782 domain-containing protein [Desulfurococcaceae archaeon]